MGIAHILIRAENDNKNGRSAYPFFGGVIPTKRGLDAIVVLSLNGSTCVTQVNRIGDYIQSLFPVSPEQT